MAAERGASDGLPERIWSVKETGFFKAVAQCIGKNLVRKVDPVRIHVSRDKIRNSLAFGAKLIPEGIKPIGWRVKIPRDG